MKGFEIKSGSRRIVLLAGRYAIKLPKPTSIKSFSLGVIENMVERSWWCSDYCIHEWDPLRPVAKFHWGSANGLVSIMERCSPLNENEAANLEDAAREAIEWQWEKYRDIKPENFGKTETGRIVWIDYGFFGFNTMYIGNPANSKTINGKQKATLRWKMITLSRKIGGIFK